MANSYREKIYQALEDLYNDYDPVIKNDSYRGPMVKRPAFTSKQVAQKAGCSIPTARKHLNTLLDESRVFVTEKRRYFCNDPVTYLWARADLPPVKLTWDQSIRHQGFNRW